MPTGPSSEVKLEIGHVLFIDIVGYSKLLIDEQSEQLRKLKEMVRGSEQVRSAEAEGKLLRLPTGDGGALVFRTTPEAPVLCAMEIARALKSHPELRVRMGIHSGPVNEVSDLNEQANIAGAGINNAQRVMDCGDAGHILLSRHVAEDLEHYPRWRSFLHELGECEVKHGVRIHLVNFYSDELGNAEVPEKFRQSQAKKKAPASSQELWIAVVPFKSAGDTEIVAFGEGLSEEITTGLSRFDYLSVVAGASAAELKGENDKAVGDKLGARYVLQGSIRKGGSSIRVTAQLVDLQTGTQLWAETYNRDLQASTIFDAQDDIAARIVATVADSYGVLIHSMREASRRKDDADFTPAEWQFQWFAYREQITPASHGALRSRLERAAKSDNRPSDLWASLAQVYLDEYAFGFPGNDVTSLDRALVAARRGVELDRANQFAMVALAQTHFFRQDLAAFGPAAERAMALNPLNTDALGILGLEIVHTGEFERGTAIVCRAMELNPNHAGWMHFAPLWNHFHKGEYEQALECANRVDVPGLFWPFLVMASACGHLGRRTEAAAAVRDLLALDPEFAAHARSNVGTWHFASGLMEPILEGLRKAGLEIPESDDSSDSLRRTETKPGTDEGAIRANEGFWVAVLPFKYSGSNADLTALAEGLTDEIITGLSRFSYLKVISRSSTLRYANASVDVRSAGKEHGARYVIEGSLRQAGARLRLAVQVVDTNSGAHLWAENYERAFSPDAVFELQDELVPRIVSTVADGHGVLPRSMSTLLRNRDPEELSPYEAVLRSFGYAERATAEELGAALSGLESAVGKAPGYGDAWAMLALMHIQDYAHGYNIRPDSLTSGLIAAQRAVEAASSNHLAYASLAQVLFFRREIQSFRNAAERSVALNSMDGDSIAMLGELMTYVGDWERGLALAGRAKQLNPNHPGWYWYADFYNSYRQGNYRDALSFALKVNLPGHWFAPAAMAACYGQLEEREAAAKAIHALLKLRPDFAATVRGVIQKWWEPDYVEHLIDGWRKAGLKIGNKPGGSAMDAAPAKSVAVLPFVNMSADKHDEYLSDGMTEELINALAKVPGLRVPGRTSCFAFKGKNETDIFRKIGDQLHVNTVLEGSVRKAGEKLRVTAQLINVSDGYHLWSKNYDGDINDILNFQSNVAEQVVQALQVHLGAEAARALSKKPTENPEAHRLYLLGRYEFAKYTQAGWNNAINYYEQALRLDPNYALAFCGLADNYAYMGSAVMPGKEANIKVEEFARKALALDPELAEAHMSLALTLVAAYDWRSGLKEFDRALELNPNLAFAYELQAWTLNGLGRSEEAIAKTRKAIELDPLNPFYQMALSFFLYWARQYDDAIAQARKTLEMDPNSAITHVLLGLSFFKKDDTAGAIAEFQKAKAPNPGAWYQGYLGYAYAISGDRAKAERILHELEDLAKRQYVSPTAFATIYLGLGQKEKCLDWLEKSYEQQDSACWYLKIDQIYDSVRNEPRFQALVQRIFGETQ
jgi:TolB-like protein/Flp pilus assembly protein TadD